MADEQKAFSKERFTALDALAFARELRHELVGAHLDRAFDLPGDGVAITWRRPGAERREVRLYPGVYGALAPAEGARSDEPSPLARDLRRWVSGGQVADVPDPHGERLVDLELRRGDVTESLVLSAEFFSPGNLVVVRGGRLVVVAHPRKWAHRVVRVGETYVRPPSRVDPWSASVAELEAALVGSRTDRVSTLAVRFALGGPLAEEVLARAEVSGSAAAPEEVGTVAPRLHDAIRGLLSEVGDRPRGFLLLRDGSIEDVEPFHAVRWGREEGGQVTVVESFSEACERYFGPRVREARVVPPPPGPRAQLERQRERQQAAVQRLSMEASLLLAEAERIFEHYGEVEAALEKLDAGDSGASEPRILNFGDSPTRVWTDRTIRESAQTIYDEAKRTQQKLAGARVALQETERRLSLATDEGAASPSVQEPSSARAARPRGFWFERFRWFISSEGVVVVAGRDAPSNDLVVRRYLKTEDLYVHADLHGAPSVVVKRPDTGQGSIGDPTLREAGQFGVAFSKAWRAGLAVSDAFWVTAEQVSKSAGTGEFVARGAWVIHGTKNFLKDLPLELALGEVEIQGVRRWTVAPPEAVRRRGTVRLLLTPGEERERPGLERELAEELGLGRTALQGLLPPGGVSVRRT